MKTVNELMAEAFPVGRAARSSEYRDGMRQALQSRLEGRRAQCPFAEGTAACDAWAAGTEEGHLIYRLEQKRGNRNGAAK